MIESNRVDLTAMTRARRLAWLFAAAFGTCVGGGFLLIALVGQTIAQGPAASFRFVLLVPAAVGVLILGAAAFGVLTVLRSAVWLQGTTVHVRKALSTRSVDLSRAYVSAGTAMRQENVGYSQTAYGTQQNVAVWEVPTLEVLDPATGRTVTLQLHRHGAGQLPPYALRALAGAMTYQRGWDGNDRDVHQLAQRLLALADRPVF